MKARKLYVDCQIFQTDAYDRGMGKYSLSLLKELLNKKYNDFEPIFVFNKNLLIYDDRISMITSLSKKSRKLVVNLPTELVDKTSKKYANAENELTNIIQSDLSGEKGAVYLILAPFFVDFAAVYPRINNILKVSLVYDIIPHLIWHRQKIFPDELYYRHYKIFETSDYLLTISSSVKKDIINFVGVSPAKLVVIDGGAFEARISSSSKNYGKYILYPSAPIVHKNNVNAVKGFLRFNKLNGKNYKLLITSNFDNKTKSDLSSICPDIVFTGNVSDEELQSLYKGCDTVLFASLAEGLGMPVLEGVHNEKPIACSNIPVLLEISKKAFYLFNPNSVSDIAHALELSVNKEGWKTKKELYRDIEKKYRWDRSALIMHKVISTIKPHVLDKKNLLISCPDPRQDSPDSKFIEKIYMELSDSYNIHIKFENSKGQSSPSFVPYICNQKSINNYDRVLTISNSIINKQNPDYDLTLIVKKFSRIKYFTNILHKKQAYPEILAKRVVKYEPLELYGWSYGKKKEDIFNEYSTKNIVGYIKELIK
jgi:glycosyltransferase involved in cell wall biosynthesis